MIRRLSIYATCSSVVALVAYLIVAGYGGYVADAAICFTFAVLGYVGVVIVKTRRELDDI